jgi:dihydrofolate reductase
MTILGSGSILAQFASHGLVDEFQVMLDPVAIGKGTSIFQNIQKQLDLKLTDHRVFKSGIIVLKYVPA